VRVSIVIAAFVIAYIISSFMTLDATTRWVPMLAAAVTLALLTIELLRCVLIIKAQRHTDPPTGNSGEAAPTTARAVTAIAYVVAGVGAIFLIGFLPALPLYLYTSIAILGRQSPRVSIVVAVLTSLLIFAVFEIALGYELYRGILFS
jgi:hypothetical protein